MKISKLRGFTVCLLLMLCVITTQVMLLPVVYAADAPQKPAINASTRFPSLTGNTGTTFTFDVDLQYVGGTDIRYVNLAVKGPVQYFFTITQSYGGTNEISSIKLDPANPYAETVRITATPNTVQRPVPGNYTFNFEATSTDLRSTVELKATVTASYAIMMVTPDGVLTTKATTGKDNIINIIVANTGSAAVENINFASMIRGTPKDWNITFDPKQIDSIAVGGTREVKVIVKPAPKTISGDYEITFNASNDAQTVGNEMTMRVTVETESIWSWVGVGVVILVVLGLIGMFIFLGKR